MNQNWTKDKVCLLVNHIDWHSLTNIIQGREQDLYKKKLIENFLKIALKLNILYIHDMFNNQLVDSQKNHKNKIHLLHFHLHHHEEDFHHQQNTL